MTFTATADSGEAIAESNEDDNTLTMHATSVAPMPNLSIDNFTVTPDPDHVGGYMFDWVIRNSGTADVTARIVIHTGYGSGNVGGVFEDISCCSHPEPMLAAGDTLGMGTGPSYFPQSGTYILTSTVDPENLTLETDETDNGFTTSVDVP